MVGRLQGSGREEENGGRNQMHRVSEIVMTMRVPEHIWRQRAVDPVQLVHLPTAKENEGHLH